MKATDIQLRGNCQCCGREQAVVNGTMAHHGYTVEHGYFEGKCQGHQYVPMQKDRTQTDAVVAFCQTKAAEHELLALQFEQGQIKPLTITRGYGKNAKVIQFADATAYEQEDAIKAAIYNNAQQAKGLRGFAKDLAALADKVHGQPLREEKKAEPTAPILEGEQRISKSGMVLTVRYVDGARVYWKSPKGGSSWTGTRAWRTLPLAQPVEEVKPQPVLAAANTEAKVEVPVVAEEAKKAHKAAGYTVENMGKKLGKEHKGQYRWINKNTGAVQQGTSTSRAAAWAACLQTQKV